MSFKEAAHAWLTALNAPERCKVHGTFKRDEWGGRVCLECLGCTCSGASGICSKCCPDH